MPTASEIVSRLEIDRLGEVLAASPKNFREELFRAAGVKVKNDSFSLQKESKNRLRTERFHQALQDGLALKPEVFEELLRNYLYTRRSLLADALDHFSVPHDNGLTDADLDFLGKLEPAKVAALRTHLLGRNHAAGDIELYVSLMNIPDAPA